MREIEDAYTVWLGTSSDDEPVLLAWTYTKREAERIVYLLRTHADADCFWSRFPSDFLASPFVQYF